MPGPSIGKPDASLPRTSSEAALTPQQEPTTIGKSQGARNAVPTTAKGSELNDAAGSARRVPPLIAQESVVHLGGIEIHGLDLAALKEGTLELTVPLNPGNKYVIPYRARPIEMKVQEGTVASPPPG